MLIEQISVFVENKLGRLAEITDVLYKEGIDIRALSIADTRDFGILRLIVNNPAAAERALKADGATVSLTKVIGIGIPDEPGGLAHVMQALNSNKISVEYMYAFLSKTDDIAYVILRVEDNERAIEVLQEKGIKVLQKDEVYDM